MGDGLLPAKRSRMSVPDSEDEDQRRPTFDREDNQISEADSTTNLEPIIVLDDSSSSDSDTDIDSDSDIDIDSDSDSEGDDSSSDSDSNSSSSDSENDDIEHRGERLAAVQPLSQNIQVASVSGRFVMENNIHRELPIKVDLKYNLRVVTGKCSACNEVTRVFRCNRCGTGAFCRRQCLENYFEEHSEQCSQEVRWLFHAYNDANARLQQNVLNFLFRLRRYTTRVLNDE